MELLPAATFDRSTLTELFNACFSDYLVPFRLDEDQFREHVETNDLDLECSPVLLDHEPVGFVLIGRRGEDAWVGGMGTRPAHRRRGLGARALEAGIESAREHGCRTVWLEVITGNRRAIHLYEKLTFRFVRALDVWSLPRADRSSPVARAAEADLAHDWIRSNRRRREPWQRADAKVAALRARGEALRGWVVERDGRINAAAVCRDTPDVLQLVAADERSAADVLLAASAEGEIRFANVPVDDPASHALKALGAAATITQHEMCLTL